MKISKKDWIFIFIIAAVFIGFYLISGEEKTTKVPYDEAHRQFYDIAKASGKMEADKGCPACRNEQGGIPFPPKHPLKPKDGPMRCLFCHKLQQK